MKWENYNMYDDRFNFFVPLDEEELEKAAQLPLEDRYNNMFLNGLASDNSEDIEGETLEPSGYVISHFLNNGYINYEHLAKRSPKFLIGEPVDAKITGNKFFIKAKLWPHSQLARDTYDKILEMKKTGTKRRPGWSIEGKSLEKDPLNPKHIKKALITNVALTFSPVNGNSFADIVKGIQKVDYVEPEYEVGDDAGDFIFEFKKDGKLYRVGKDYKVYEVLKKAMDTEAIKPLTPESLEKKSKNLEPYVIQKALSNVFRYRTLLDQNEDLRKKIVANIKNSV